MRHVTAQPRDQPVEAELVGLVEPDNKSVRLLRTGRETRAVDGEKGIRGGESRALVAVDEGTVLRKTLPERGSFLNQVGVISGLRPVEAGFQQPRISDALGAAVALDLVGVHGQDFGHCKVVRHLASFL
jgi:hypothetical protein